MVYIIGSIVFKQIIANIQKLFITLLHKYSLSSTNSVNELLRL